MRIQRDDRLYAQCDLQEFFSKYDNIELEKNKTIYERINASDYQGISIPVHVRLLVVIGYGCMRYIRKIQDINPNTKILIYEPDEYYFAYAAICDKLFLSEENDDMDIVIVIGKGELEILLKDAVQRLSGLTNLYHMYGIVSPGYGDLYPGMLGKTVMAVQRILMANAAEYETTIQYGRTVLKNELYALSMIGKSALLGDLFRKMSDKDMPIVLVGAGPSLEKNAEQLKDISGRALIIACTRATETLEKYGVKADLVVMIDPEEGHDYCAHDPNRTYSLLFYADSAIDIQKYYAGKGIYFGFHQNLFPLTRLNEEQIRLATGGSVITCIFSYLLNAGYRNFVLVGEDLAFDDNQKTHSGSYLEKAEGQIFETMGINGSIVRTRADWNIFRMFFEQELERHPEITITDATEGGALIKGSRVRALREWMGTLADQTYPIADWINGLPKGNEKDVSEVMQVFENLHNRCIEIQYLIKEALLWNDRIMSMLVAENQESSIYQNACVNYDRLYHEIVDDKKWEFLRYYYADCIYEYAEETEQEGKNPRIKQKIENEKKFFQNIQKAIDELRVFLTEIMTGILCGN
ncbi:MAG: motility associated factor glycosyltransferase family protein [Lachnospiraceae bacterium]|nr:motility associated factor glycosyltransferase family protein [Lachnospiraceae bacterium]